MKKLNQSKHWRTSIIAVFAMLLFIAAGVAVFAGFATFTEATSFLSIIAMPLMFFGFRMSADSKSVEQNQYNP